MQLHHLFGLLNTQCSMLNARATFQSVDNGDDYINCHFLLLVRVFQCDAGLVFLNLGCIVAKRSPHGALSWSIWHKFHLYLESELNKKFQTMAHTVISFFLF